MAKLKRQLGLLDVFALSAGAMISSGLFVLPAIAFDKAGPAVILSYLFASILILPSVLAQAELATAMPRAGGTYFFVERSMGTLWGLFGGLANWFSLALKSAFAVVGMAVFVEVFIQRIFGVTFESWHLKMIAVLCCLGFTLLNIVSVKHTGKFQVVLVAVLLAILTVFIVVGSRSTDAARYSGFLGKGWLTVFATSAMVFISFGGLTQVASVAEEVRNPSRDILRGMVLAWLVVTVLYVGVIAVTVGVVDKVELVSSYTPISLSASKFMGTAGYAILSVAAIAAFVTTANGGILAASRSPMAMSRDSLLPEILSRINKRYGTPHISIVLTFGFMAAAISFLNIESLVKTASTLVIILFVLTNASVIIMRQSRIQSYRPTFKSPLHPMVHLVTIIVYGLLIVDMGAVPLIICGGFVLLSVVWYLLYVSRRVSRASAVMHIVERVTDIELKTVTLENELRDILIERDNIIEDRFDKLVRDCRILDIKGKRKADDVFREISEIFSIRLDISEYVLLEKFIEREQQGTTIVEPGLAIPHIVIDGENKFDIMLVRAVDGIIFPNADEPVTTMFVLTGTRDQRNYHLRALMAIAQIAQSNHFRRQWLEARDTQAMRNLILLSTRKRDSH